MRGASRRFFTNRSTTTSMLQGVRRSATDKQSSLHWELYSLFIAPSRSDGAPGTHPSPKLPADAKGAQRAECPHPNHIVLPTTAQSGNSPLLPYQRRRSVSAAYAMHRTVAKCFICFTYIIPFRAAHLPRSEETRLPAASLPNCDARLPRCQGVRRSATDKQSLLWPRLGRCANY